MRHTRRDVGAMRCCHHQLPSTRKNKGSFQQAAHLKDEEGQLASEHRQRYVIRIMIQYTE